jgi:transcriptional regulator with XRE-family HTH domain
MSDIFADYSFGGWLRRFRIKREIGLREMSRTLGVDPANYCKIERSELNPPSLKKIIELKDKMKLSEDEFEMLKSLSFQFHFCDFKKKWESK